jgi:hypothetical protein
VETVRSDRVEDEVEVLQVLGLGGAVDEVVVKKYKDEPA